MKKLVALFLVITFVFTLGGCFGEKTEKVTTEDVKNRVISEAEEYLKENYPDDEFTYISGRSPNWAYNYYELGFSSKNYDDQLVTVFADINEEKTKEDSPAVYNYSDDYYQYYMLEDAEKYFYDLAKPYLGDKVIVKVSFSTGIGVAEKITGYISFSDFCRQDVGMLKVYFFHNYDEEWKDVEEFVNVLKNECGMYCQFAKIKDGREDYITIASLKEITSNSSENYEKELSYVFDYDGNIM